jgi:hypothetical protein
MTLRDLLDHARAVVERGDVGGDRIDRETLGLAILFSRHRGVGLGGVVVRDDLAAVLCETGADRGSDSADTTGDECNSSHISFLRFVIDLSCNTSQPFAKSP